MKNERNNSLWYYGYCYTIIWSYGSQLGWKVEDLSAKTARSGEGPKSGLFELLEPNVIEGGFSLCWQGLEVNMGSEQLCRGGERFKPLSINIIIHAISAPQYIQFLLYPSSRSGSKQATRQSPSIDSIPAQSKFSSKRQISRQPQHLKEQVDRILKIRGVSAGNRKQFSRK